jgi:uncharacterized protein YoxC
MDALTLKLSIISLLINSIGTIFIGITVFLMWKQIKEASRLNRWENTQKTLDDLTTGEFHSLRDRIEKEFDCRIWDHNEDYDKKVCSLDKENREELDFALGGLLNMLETFCIKIKNKFIEEDMCYDYLGFIMVEYKRWSEPFIAVKIKDNPLSLAILVVYADKWSKRLEENREKRSPAPQTQEQTPNGGTDTVASEIGLLRQSLQTLNARLRIISEKLLAADPKQGDSSSVQQNRISLSLELLSRTEQRAEVLRKQLLELIEKETAIKSRLVQIEEDMRPESIERASSLVGSTRTPEL